ncbi:hypothetical protein [Cytobacillus kochii]|uniref:hypothetical protein n=1 Tax=Cytobacillus kochii TaxID=859143 RepID=UPI00402A77FD
MPTQTVLYASRILTAGAVKELSRKVKDLLAEGKELEANILLLRYAGKRSNQILRKEVDEWQPSRKLG